MGAFISRLMDGGVRFPPVPEPVLAEVADGQPSLDGKVFVFTGKLHAMTRDEGKQMVLSLRRTVTGSISAKTDYLVAGEKAGSKLAKAQALGVEVLTEREFLDWVSPESG